MHLEVFGNTHVGMKRNHNEDAFLVLPDEHLFCVADGMGGHASGEIASKIAIEELAEFFQMTSRDLEATWPYKMDKSRNYDENRLATGVKLANVRIFERASGNPDLKGMGTTIVTTYFVGTSAYVAHVGDSRVYSFRAGALTQLTEDHSLLNEYLKAKKLSADEAEGFQYKNIISRALGMGATVQVDVNRFDTHDGDLFLLCSDGLSGMVPNDMLKEVLLTTHDLEAAVGQLIDLANTAGGTDNITCVLARYHA